jgi:peptide/nickel transport system substrate-binding protein
MKRKTGLILMISLTLIAWVFSSPVHAQSKPKDMLSVGLYQDLSSFDAHTTPLQDQVMHFRDIYDPLVDVSNEDPTNFQPVLAESWSISQDGLTYTFKLRKGVKFADGTDFNAEAAKFNFDRFMSLKKGGTFSVLSLVDSATVKDADTLEVKFKQPGPMLSFLAYSYMVSPTAVKQHATNDDPWATNWLADHTVGTAPYRLEEYVRGVRYKLVENPHYWGRKPYFKTVDCRLIYEVDVQRVMLEKGDLDLAMLLPIDALPSLKKNPAVRIHEDKAHSSMMFLFDHIAEPTKNPLVRKALAHAWNHEAFSTVRRGLAPRLNSPVPPIMLGEGYKEPLIYEYDLKKAKEYLVQAGYPDGFTINVLTQKGDEEKKMMFDVFQNDLAKIGIKCNLQEKTFPAMVATSKDKTLMSDPQNAMHLQIFFLSPQPFTPWKVLVRGFATESQPDKPTGAMNFGYYSNPKVDEFVAKALASTDQKKAIEFWRKANDELILDYACIPTFSKMAIVGTRADIEGYKFRAHYFNGVCIYSELSRKK